MKYEIVKSEKHGDSMLVTILETPNWFERLIFDWVKRKTQFVGDCTVWHSYPECERAPTWLEIILSDYWEQWKD